MKPTLVIMAAGIGSRYGGLKQIDPVGPTGEIVIDYSVYDAWKAGFGDVVFIIRRDIENDFKKIVEKNIARHLPVTYVFQDLDDLPSGFSVPSNREKPWGTTHAIYACREYVTRPFAVINADDFYGAESFVTLCQHLESVNPAAHDYSLVAYVLQNTLSDHGTVTRGVCEIENKKVTQVVERMKIEPHLKGARYEEDGAWKSLTGAEPVSMNFWGFTPALFEDINTHFPAFLSTTSSDLKAEFLIPRLVDDLIKNGTANVTALRSNAKWLGVTYPEDKAIVTAGIQTRIDAGEYPADLWGQSDLGTERLYEPGH